MKAGKSLAELAAEIMRQAESKRDYIAPAKLVTMNPQGEVALGNGQKTQPMALTEHARGQLADWLGIPKTYLDRMAKDAPALMAENVNTWLQMSDNKRMVRTLDGRVRAILSDKYRPLENFDLAEAVLPVLQDLDLYVVSCDITERRLYVKAFDKRIEREIKVRGSDPAHTFMKDVCFPAISISNSEVGGGALSVAAGLYTDGCTNWAIFNDSRMRKYHVGSKAAGAEDVYALLTDETKRLTDAAIWAQTRDVVRSAFEIARFEELVGRVQETADDKITGDVVKVVEVAGDRLALNTEERKSVLRHLIEGGNLSRYGLFNAVTRTAEDIVDYDRATEIERAGGKVIELERNAWHEIMKEAA